MLVVIVVVVVVVVFLTGGFYISGLLSLQPALHPGFSGLWRPPPALSSTLATFGCFTLARLFVTVLPRALRFWVGIFYPQAFFTLHSFPTFLARFLTQMWAGTPHPGSSSVPTLKELSLLADAWTWTTHIVVTRQLIYQLRQWARTYRVKIEVLNMFCLLKVIWKDYKNTLKKAW